MNLYRGWIPAVTGRLSFSHFGKSEKSSTVSYLNRADGGKRFLVISQRRDTWDVLLPFRQWLGESVFGLRGRFYFVLVAETFDQDDDVQSVLQGKVYLISESSRWVAIVRPTLKIKTKEFIECFESADPIIIRQKLEPHIREIENVCEKNSAFNASFILRRNGIFDLFVEERIISASTAPKLPSKTADSKHLRSILAAQLFYFVRDIAHKHRHHSPTTDTIVDLHLLGSDLPHEDRKWRMHTLYSIYRRIISSKRQDSVEVQILSTGLLAYAKAFKQIWLDDFCSKENAKIPTFFDEALKESIQASDVSMRFKLQAAQERSDTFRTVVIAILGIAISASGLLNLTGVKFESNPSVLLIILARYLIESPLVIGSMIFCGLYFLIVLRKSRFRLENFRLVKFFQALTVTFPKQVASSAFVLLGVLSSMIALAVVLP